jgi:transposase InsO family protein
MIKFSPFADQEREAKLNELGDTLRLLEEHVGLLVSWTIGTRPDAMLVNTMLDAAIETVTNHDERPIIHSDRGSHYRWPGWLSRMQSAKLTRSMSRKACSPDNAACEGFFGRLKTSLSEILCERSHTIKFIPGKDTYDDRQSHTGQTA